MMTPRPQEKKKDKISLGARHLLQMQKCWSQNTKKEKYLIYQIMCLKKLMKEQWGEGHD